MKFLLIAFLFITLQSSVNACDKHFTGTYACGFGSSQFELIIEYDERAQEISVDDEKVSIGERVLSEGTMIIPDPFFGLPLEVDTTIVKESKCHLSILLETTQERYEESEEIAIEVLSKRRFSHLTTYILIDQSEEVKQLVYQTENGLRVGDPLYVETINKTKQKTIKCKKQ